MPLTHVSRVVTSLVFGTICGLGAACCLDNGPAHALSPSEMRATVGAVSCVDKVPQNNCTSVFSGCIDTATPEQCTILACNKCTTDTAYSDCNSNGTNYKTCTVETTGGGCGTISVASCSIQDKKCKCGTFTGTTNACALKKVTATTKCPE